MQIQYFEQKVNMDIQRYIFAMQNTVVFCVWLVLYGREGNGTPLQYSCLENPMDGGAW